MLCHHRVFGVWKERFLRRALCHVWRDYKKRGKQQEGGGLCSKEVHRKLQRASRQLMQRQVTRSNCSHFVILVLIGVAVPGTMLAISADSPWKRTLFLTINFENSRGP